MSHFIRVIVLYYFNLVNINKTLEIPIFAMVGLVFNVESE